LALHKAWPKLTVSSGTPCHVGLGGKNCGGTSPGVRAWMPTTSQNWIGRQCERRSKHRCTTNWRHFPSRSTISESSQQHDLLVPLRPGLPGKSSMTSHSSASSLTSSPTHPNTRTQGG